MKRLLIVSMALIMLVCLVPTPAFATSETLPTDFNDFSDMIHELMEPPVDYERLFDLSDLVDGAYSESYFYWMNQLFDAEPEAFVTALSKQSNNRIDRFAFSMALEHSQDLDGYRACLDTVQQSVSDDSPEGNTLDILRKGIQKVESLDNNPTTSDSPVVLFIIVTVVATLALSVTLKKRHFLM